MIYTFYTAFVFFSILTKEKNLRRSWHMGRDFPRLPAKFGYTIAAIRCQQFTCFTQLALVFCNSLRVAEKGIDNLCLRMPRCHTYTLKSSQLFNICHQAQYSNFRNSRRLASLLCHWYAHQKASVPDDKQIKIELDVAQESSGTWKSTVIMHYMGN